MISGANRRLFAWIRIGDSMPRYGEHCSNTPVRLFERTHLSPYKGRCSGGCSFVRSMGHDANDKKRSQIKPLAHSRHRTAPIRVRPRIGAGGGMTGLS